MNKKGQSWGIMILSALIIFLVGMTIINILKPEITNARSDLSCSDTTISDGAKILCLVVDSTLIYFILTIFSAAGGALISRINL